MSGPKWTNRYDWVTHEDGTVTLTEKMMPRDGGAGAEDRWWKTYPSLDDMLANLPDDVANAIREDGRPTGSLPAPGPHL